MWRRRALAATGTLAALLLTTGGVATATAAAGPALTTHTWGECPAVRGLDPRQRCASLTVPRDYSAPGGATIEIAVSRIATATPEQRRGILLFNPGGPGSSGINGPSRLAATLPSDVLARYDLVGFDPRGIRYSAPVSCSLAPADRDVLKFIPYPAHDLDISANVAYARRVADGCAATSGDLLPHITTANTARDMDAIRAAFDEARISYIGYSYGTTLGAVYATLFPQRTDRFVLDSNVDPRRTGRDVFTAWGYSVELAFEGFARWAAGEHPESGLGATPQAVHAKVIELAHELEREPIELAPGYYVDGNRFRELIRNDALRNDRAFPALVPLLQAIDAREPSARTVARTQRLLETIGAGPAAEDEPATTGAPATAAFPAVPDDNDLASPWAIVCGDADWPASPALHQRDVRAYDALFPIHGRAAANIWPCAFWHSEPREPAVTIGALTDGQALVVQSIRDPATPVDGGVAMRSALGSRARLVTVEDGAHSVALNAINRCADAHVAAFLAAGTLPRHDAHCQRDAPLATAAPGPLPRPLGDAGLISLG